MDGSKIEVGKIVNTRGLRGEIKLVSWCDDPADFEFFSSVWLKDEAAWKEYSVQSVHYIKGSVGLMLEGIDTVEKAQKLVGRVVYADRSEFELEEGAYFIQDLIGLSVVLEDGTPFGVLSEVFQTGSNDVYCVKTQAHGMVYLPCIKEVVKAVDLEAGRITVHLLDGILD